MKFPCYFDGKISPFFLAFTCSSHVISVTLNYVTWFSTLLFLWHVSKIFAEAMYATAHNVAGSQSQFNINSKKIWCSGYWLCTIHFYSIYGSKSMFIINHVWKSKRKAGSGYYAAVQIQWRWVKGCFRAKIYNVSLYSHLCPEILPFSLTFSFSLPVFSIVARQIGAAVIGKRVFDQCERSLGT